MIEGYLDTQDDLDSLLASQFSSQPLTQTQDETITGNESQNIGW